VLFSISLDEESHVLDLASMTIREGAECERLTGWTWDEWRIELGKGKANAVAYAWWLACKRSGAPIPGRFSDVDFDMGAMKFKRLDGEEPEDEPEEEGAPTGPTGPGQEEAEPSA